MSWEPARPSLAVRVAVAGIVAAATAGLFASLGRDAPPQGEVRASEELDVHEAVLRYQFIHNASSRRVGAQVYCLTVLGADPDEALLQRFARHAVPVRKASSCKMDGRVLDPATGALGLALYMEQVEWVSSNEVTVNGGYYEASLSASRNVYRLRKQGNHWTVVADRLILIT